MFHSEDHLIAFGAARKLTQTGTSLHGLCGAKTRNGGYCRQLPLSGHRRCLRHAGPKAANEFRDRQRRAMERGKISFREFDLAEKRRAANRLHDQWKKNPWLTGATIDLLHHEAGLLDEVRHWSGSIDQVPPAVMDWLRRQYRWLQLDRVDTERWIETLRSELPRRVRNAGSRRQPSSDGTAPAFETTSWPADHSSHKRSGPDFVRAVPDRTPTLPKSTSFPAVTARRVAEIVKASSAVLSPLLALCFGDNERDKLIAALVSYVERPADASARRRWQDTIQALKAR